jgi:hypothetical protein
MKTRLLFLLILISTFLCQAQNWRVEASGGFSMTAAMGHSQRVPPPHAPFSIMEINTEDQIISPIGGLRVARRDSMFEYGIGVQITTFKFSGYSAVDTGGRHFFPAQKTYLANPGIPLTAFFNYGHLTRKAYAFVGLSAGVFFAQGKEMKDANELRYYEDFDIYFHDAVGYTIGGQLGFRRSLGKIDFGLELAMNFVHLALKQGESNTSYNYNVFYFPVKGFIGYSF